MADFQTHATLTQNLVSYWDMEEASGVRIDRHGTNHLSDIATVTQATGKLGNAGQFTSANSEQLDISDNASLSITGDLSVSVWAYFDSLKNCMIVSKRDDASTRSYTFTYEYGSTELQFIISSDGTSGDETTGAVTWTPTLSTWYHIVCIYRASSGEVDFYIDGSQQGSTQGSLNTSIADTSADFNVGANGTSGDYMNGRFDELALWSKELTSGEVTALYNSGTPLPYATKTTSKFVRATTQYLSIPDSASLSMTSTVTIEAWVKVGLTPATDEGYYVLSKGIDGGANSYNVIYQNSSDVFTMKMNIYDTAADTTNNISSWSTGELDVGRWYHMAWTFDKDSAGTECEFFMDGVSWGTAANAADDIDDNTGLVYIGSNPGNTNGFDGEICEVRIWNDIRTQAEITANARVELDGDEAGLVGYWKMNDYTRLLDLTSNSNDITVNTDDVTWVVDHPFRADGNTENTHSIDLEAGSSQYLSITDASQTGLDFTTDFSIEAWVKLESAPATDVEYCIAQKWEDSSEGWVFAYRDSSSTKQLRLFYYDGSTNITISTFNTDIQAGQWYHVAVTVDISASTAKFYVNGKETAGTAGTQDATTLGDTAHPFQIGARATPSNYFDGLIQNLRVWSEERTHAEIRQNMGVRNPVDSNSKLQGNWLFDNDATDSSSNSNDLTPSGSPVYSVDRLYNYDSFWSDADPETTSVDGHVKDADASWNTAHDETTAATVDYSGATFAIGVNKNGTYGIYRTPTLFDTSAITDTDTIDSATITLVPTIVTDDDGDQYSYIAIVDCTLGSPTTLATTDYPNIGDAVDNPTEHGTRNFIGGMVVATPETFIVNSTGLGTVDATGISYFAFREGHDINDVAPAGTNTTRITAHSADNTTGISVSPRLEVSHSSAGSSGPANLKTLDTVAKASIKTINGVAIASVKTFNTVV